MRCPACRGMRITDLYQWQNDGHGRQEHVWVGRGKCPMCEGYGHVPDPSPEMGEFVEWLDSL
jgi:hypothetical protein